MQGVECFDYSKTLNVMVTGGTDHVVRLWNPYVTSRAVALLHGHSMAIVDVKIYEPLAQVFSYSRDTVCIAYSAICPSFVLLGSRYPAKSGE